MTDEALRAKILQQAQGATALSIAFIGVANRLFVALEEATSVADLAVRASVNTGYLQCWCEAAYAFGYLDERNGRFSLTDLGRAFRPDTPETLMPLAIQSVLGAHMADRAVGLMKTGERPGESVLAESASILPWFGPMLEAAFGAMFEREILPNVAAYRDVDRRGGLAVDLGCGNGWYLRKLARRFPRLRGLGLDGFEENIRQATERASIEGLAPRLTFEVGDIYGFESAEPVELIAMNRALHHVWDQRDKVFAILHDNLRPGGFAVIWEPSWPAGLEALREPRRRGMAFQNLSEHVQGNHFLRPDEIEAAFRSVGMRSTTQLFGEGTEAVVVGMREH